MAEDEPSSNLFRTNYELEELIGVGAFGKVYRARDLHSGEHVAIKSLSKHSISKQNPAAHITREISIMRRLAHPHIVRLHEVLANKSKIYFVMDYANGGELFTQISTKGRFSEDLSRRYFHQLISAVGYCHDRGVYHRDLKPENLLLDANLDLKVTDFGLGALTDQIRPDGLLHTMCGTPAYVAPEVLGKKGYDGAKIDVWSCGVILYVLNAGYLPFNDTNLMAMYRKIYRGQFRYPRWFSPGLKRLLTRILDPNPSTRITIHEIIVNDPWFSVGYKEISHAVPIEFEFRKEYCGGKETRFLNAFDLISFSSGMELSGLLSTDDGENRVNREMFVSDELPKRIIERIEAMAKEESVSVIRKGTGMMRLEAQNGEYVAMVEINRLTEELVVVEVKRGGFGLDFWKRVFMPRLSDLVH